jgi:hypothetical protein
VQESKGFSQFISETYAAPADPLIALIKTLDLSFGLRASILNETADTLVGGVLGNDFAQPVTLNGAHLVSDPAVARFHR